MNKNLLSDSSGRPRSVDESHVDLGSLGEPAAGISVCLPADLTGSVVVVASEAVSRALRVRYPEAILLRRGSTQPIPSRNSVGLLVLDFRDVGNEDLMSALAPLLHTDAVVATIEGSGQFATRLKRRADLRTSSRRGVPVLKLQGEPFESLADRIAADVGSQLDVTLTLTGVITAGQPVLRFATTGEFDLVVRLSFESASRDAKTVARIAQSVPAISEHVVGEIGAGTTCGCRWVAMPWVGGDRASRLRNGTFVRSADSTIRKIADALAGHRTGSTSAGWSQSWIDRFGSIPEDVRQRFVQALVRLESGLPTGWCHGDLRTGNVLVEGSRHVIIDWDRARDDAPLGLDNLLLKMLKKKQQPEDLGLARAGIELVDDFTSSFVIAGAQWRTWDRKARVAFVLAAYVIQSSSWSLADRDNADLDRDVVLLLNLIDSRDPGDGDDASETDQSGRSSTTRGAGWLGLGAGITKISQTTVLLVLAALLAPSAMGILAIGALVLNISSALTDLGSSTALVYWRGDVERAARSALTIAVTFAVALTGVMWLLAPWLSAALNAGNEGTAVVRGLMLCLPFMAVSAVSGELLRRSLAFRRRVVPDIVGAVVGMSASIVLAVDGHGVYSLVIGQLIQSVVVVVLFWMMRAPVRLGWNHRDMVGLISYGGHLAGADILQLIMLNLDYLIVARVLGTYELGVYSMAFRLAYMPYLLVSVVMCGAAFAHLCRLDGRDVGEAASGLAVSLIALVTPLYLGMILLAPQLQLLGDKWAPGVPALRWLAVYGFLLSLVHVGLVTLNSVSRTRRTMMLNLIHLVLLAGLMVSLARFGVTIVAVAQVVAVAGMLIATLLMLGRSVAGLEFRRHIGRLGTIVLGSALMLAVALLLQFFLPWTRVSVPGFILVGLLSLIAYAVPHLPIRRGRFVSDITMIGSKP